MGKNTNPSIGKSYGGARAIKSNIGARSGKPGTMRKSKSKGSKSYGSYG